jgi:paired amphipathic helix protein Sin3a
MLWSTQEINLACSGRDELARSVLNDEWVSHPTWASEEAGFVSHKKNINEDALHACEQERHEFDIFIQANARTIAILEPIWERVQEMTTDEKAGFRLPHDLGGPTKSIYVRIIKRIYGGAQWAEVWDALQNAPAVAVGVVLARLRQKDEEWRREQRVWSKIWRGVEAKNFYKSLDHMGNNEHKNQEKKSITTKYLVADVENKRKVQLDVREKWNSSHTRRRRWFAEGSPGHQLQYSFPDTSVLHDSLKMVYSFLDHSQALYSQPERRAVETFLRQFVPLLLMLPEAEFNAACGPLEPAHAEEMASDTNGMVDGAGVPASDLRKKLLETAHETGLASRAASSPPDRGTPSDDLKASTTDDIWIRQAATNQPAGTYANGVSNPRRIPFFANSTYYALLRLLQVMHCGLLLCVIRLLIVIGTASILAIALV